MKRNTIQVNEEKSTFQLFFLKDDQDVSVEVEEVEDIDFTEVKRRIERGESVFITHKRRPLNSQYRIVSKETRKPWYFTHS